MIEQIPRVLQASARLPHPSPPANTQPHPLLLLLCSWTGTGAKHFAFPNEHGKTEAKQKREQKRDQSSKKKEKGRRKKYSKKGARRRRRRRNEL